LHQGGVSLQIVYGLLITRIEDILGSFDIKDTDTGQARRFDKISTPGFPTVHVTVHCQNHRPFDHLFHIGHIVHHRKMVTVDANDDVAAIFQGVYRHIVNTPPSTYRSSCMVMGSNTPGIQEEAISGRMISPSEK